MEVDSYKYEVIDYKKAFELERFSVAHDLRSDPYTK